MYYEKLKDALRGALKARLRAAQLAKRGERSLSSEDLARHDRGAQVLRTQVLKYADIRPFRYARLATQPTVPLPAH